jgi:hypothetical protein
MVVIKLPCFDGTQKSLNVVEAMADVAADASLNTADRLGRVLLIRELFDHAGLLSKQLDQRQNRGCRGLFGEHG